MKLHDILQENLKEKKMTQTLLATRCKASRVQMNRYFRGIALPKLETAIRMARILDFNLNEIHIEGDEI